jgi:GAF domain-containing protein
MPEGHLPVRSYLAAPVVSHSGEVLGGLFFGHETTGVFTEQHEQIVRGIAGQAAIALDNARLFAETKRAQEELNRANSDLRRANADLEQFAYSASHDLQEPIRNVSIYGEILSKRYGQCLDAKGREYLSFVSAGGGAWTCS